MQYRKKKHGDMTIKSGIRMAISKCQNCDLLRMVIIDEYFGAAYCIFNKCIKQYPHKVDNGRFK